MKWVAAYFPFTRPSLLLEIFFQNDWIEVLGASLMKLVLGDSAEKNRVCGEGQEGIVFKLERIAMLLFNFTLLGFYGIKI